MWILAIVLAVLAPTSSAKADTQWTVISLNPPGAQAGASLNGVGGGQQVGVVSGNAALWSGTADSWVDLGGWQAFGIGGAQALGVGDGQQVGYVFRGGFLNASLWTGTAESWVDLQPEGAQYSVAFGVHGGQQVGVVGVPEEIGSPNAVQRASLWTGTAESWVDLTPAGGLASDAYGVNDGHQVGDAFVDGHWRASLWNGTAGSWVDLHPAGMWASMAYGVGGGQQVGAVTPDAYQFRAAVWSGTADSWVDLHPAWATNSYAVSVSGGQQVGYANDGQADRACLWSGTAASLVDLHALLPSSYSFSRALGIWRDATGSTYVVGTGLDGNTNVALMWVLPPNTGGDAAPVDVNGGASQPGGATIDFSSVTAPGYTSVTTLTSAPALPSGFNLTPTGTFFDVATSAQFTGSVEVCLNYNDAGLSDESSLLLLHYADGEWTNVTSSLNTTTNIICGTVSSLSPFAIVQTPPALPGAMHGEGVVKSGQDRYQFEFDVREGLPGRGRDRFSLEVNYGRRTELDKRGKPQSASPEDGRFKATVIDAIVFSDDPTIRPGRSRKPQVDTVVFSGRGEWNRRSGYTFEVRAADQGEPGRHRESISIVIRDAAGQTVAQASGDLASGNVQSGRIKHGGGRDR